METARGWVGVLWAVAIDLLPLGAALAEVSSEWFVLAGRGPVPSLVSSPAELALKKLESPACSAVLSEFHDGSGKLLSENLRAVGMRAHEYFTHLRFVDGKSVALCGRTEVAAGANPGVPVIVICTATFARVSHEDPGLAANVLIHEMLHALGLATDDPPTSREITRQVVKRCGP